MAALISTGDVDQGQGPVLRQPLRGDGDRGAAARRQRLRPRLRRLRQEHPLRPRRRQERRPRGRAGDPRGAREDGEFSSLWDFCERVDSPRRQQARGRVPDQVRRARLDRRDRAGRCSRRCRRRQPSARRRRRTPGCGQGSIFDLGGGGGARRRGSGARASTRRSLGEEFEQRELLRLEKETLGTFLSAHPLSEVRDALRARVDCSLSELGAKAGRLLGHGRRHRHRVQAAHDQARRAR